MDHSNRSTKNTSLNLIRQKDDDDSSFIDKTYLY